MYLHRINGTPAHVHLAMNIEPMVTISEMVGELKGACSFELNKAHGKKVLEWQRGFGVVSFGKGNLDWILAYIANQKEHHAVGTAIERLERIDSEEVVPSER